MASGCVFSGAPDDAEKGPRTHVIAVGATVELSFTDCSAGDAPRLVHCIPTYLDAIESLEVDDNFELIESRVSGSDAYATLRARAEGKARLHLAYVDWNGMKRSAEVALRAVHPASIEAHASCDRGLASGRDVPVFGSASTFSVHLEPRTEQGELVETGELELFDFGAFEVLERHYDLRFVLRAPTEPGSYAWSSVAGDRYEVAVHAPGAAKLAAGLGASSVLVAPDVPGPLCTSGPDSVAIVSVKQGDCQVGFDTVRLSGAAPVWVPASGTELQVTGRGQCTLSATMNGEVVEHTLTVAPPTPRPAPGLAIGTAPLRFDLQPPVLTARCDDGFTTDGVCTDQDDLIPDLDCLSDADFRIEPFDALGSIEPVHVGKGLTTSVALGVLVAANTFKAERAPMDVTWRYDERLLGALGSPDDVRVQIGDCMAPYGEKRLVQIQVDAVGPHQIEFEASNIDDIGELDFTAFEVHQALIEALIDGTKVSDSDGSVFAGSSLTLTARYVWESGLPLRGDAPLEVVSSVADSGASVAQGGALFVGDVPSTLQVTPTVGRGGLQLRVAREEAVASLQVARPPAAAQVSDVICLETSAYDTASKLIRGRGPVPVTAKLEGDGSAWVFVADPRVRTVCLRAVETGLSTLALSMGDAAVQQELPPVTRAP